MNQSAGYSRDEKMFGSVATVGTAGVFGQVMGLVAVTLVFFTSGAYLGREISEGASIICFIGGFVCIIGLNFTRRWEGLSITLLFAAGLLLGMGMGGVLTAMPKHSPKPSGRRPRRPPCSSVGSAPSAMPFARTSRPTTGPCSSCCSP